MFLSVVKSKNHVLTGNIGICVPKKALMEELRKLVRDLFSKASLFLKKGNYAWH